MITSLTYVSSTVLISYCVVLNLISTAVLNCSMMMKKHCEVWNVHYDQHSIWECDVNIMNNEQSVTSTAHIHKSFSPSEVTVITIFANGNESYPRQQTPYAFDDRNYKRQVWSHESKCFNPARNIFKDFNSWCPDNICRRLLYVLDGWLSPSLMWVTADMTLMLIYTITAMNHQHVFRKPASPTTSQ